MMDTRTKVEGASVRQEAALRCAGLRKRFGSTPAVARVDLEVRRGQLMALLGPSGCGKTTTLRMIAGLERPDAGDIWIHGRHVGGGAWVPPEHRRVGLVFQDLALFPHLDVRGNVAFGLRDAPAERVEEMVALARLQGLERRMPHELSGGQQQRVALARSLLPGPDLMLLDEPFSNLDRTLRADVRAEVRDLLRAADVTSVFVTHDHEEALSIADQVAVMMHGEIRQVGSPFEVYTNPVDDEVAGLVGEINLLPGTITSGRVSSPVGDFVASGVPDGACRVLIRPEAVEVIPDEDAESAVLSVAYFGHDQLIRCSTRPPVHEVVVRVLGAKPAFSEGDRVRLRLAGPALALPA